MCLHCSYGRSCVLTRLSLLESPSSGVKSVSKATIQRRISEGWVCWVCSTCCELSLSQRKPCSALIMMITVNAVVIIKTLRASSVSRQVFCRTRQSHGSADAQRLAATKAQVCRPSFDSRHPQRLTAGRLKKNVNR